jgi:hypothetical protein
MTILDAAHSAVCGFGVCGEAICGATFDFQAECTVETMTLAAEVLTQTVTPEVLTQYVTLEVEEA